MLTALPTEILYQDILSYLNAYTFHQFHKSMKTKINNNEVMDAYLVEWNALPIMKRISYIINTQQYWNIHLEQTYNQSIYTQLKLYKAGVPRTYNTISIYGKNVKKRKIWIHVYDSLGNVIEEDTDDINVSNLHITIYRKFHSDSVVHRTISSRLNLIYFTMKSGIH